jgi:hypothetical protein
MMSAITTTAPTLAPTSRYTEPLDAAEGSLTGAAVEKALEETTVGVVEV